MTVPCYVHACSSASVNVSAIQEAATAANVYRDQQDAHAIAMFLVLGFGVVIAAAVWLLFRAPIKAAVGKAVHRQQAAAKAKKSGRRKLHYDGET